MKIRDPMSLRRPVDQSPETYLSRDSSEETHQYDCIFQATHL